MSQQTANERIKILRMTLKLSQSEFARSLGVKQAAISAIELAVNAPTDRIIKAITSAFNCNYNWIVSGVGEMFNSESSSTENFAPVANDDQAWREIALKQYDLIAELIKTNNTVANSHNTLTDSHKILAETNSRAMNAIEKIGNEIVNLLREGVALVPKAKKQTA